MILEFSCFCPTSADQKGLHKVYLSLYVEVDESAEKTSFFKASTFTETFQEILARPDV